MEPKSQNGTGSDRLAGHAQLSEPDELTSFAQEYFSSDFPNAERLGCPTSGTLDNLVRAGSLPNDLLRAHLFGCSECFREYRAAILEHKEHQTPVAASSWSHRLPPLKHFPVPIYATAIALLLFSLVSLYFWRSRRSESIATVTPTQSSTNEAPVKNVSPESHTVAPIPPVSKPLPATPEQSPTIAQGRAGPGEFKEDELLAMNTVAVDLEEFTALRGGEESKGRGEASQSIKLITPRTRLKLKLPAGSPPGRFTISIVNAAGETLLTVKAATANGTQLGAVLNLQNIAPGSYLLRLTRVGEVPSYYPVTIKE